jgi:hypothetical protein
MKHAIPILTDLLVFQSQALPKRTAAPTIAPVVHYGVQYVVPNDNGRKGYVRAVDARTGNTLWEKAIFKVWINPLEEADVQWVFIASIILKDDTLILTDERARRFVLDLKTKKVMKLKNNEKAARKLSEPISKSAPAPGAASEKAQR